MKVRDQRGMTLVEILVATAIAGLVMSVPSMAIYQFITITGQGSGKMTALHDIQNTAQWIALDGQMAKDAVGGSQLVLTLPASSSITYTLVGTGPRYELRRTAGASQITVARNITSLNFSVNGRIITMTITSSPNSRWELSEQRVYKVYLRPAM